jgi:hypothetical protein
VSPLIVVCASVDTAARSWFQACQSIANAHAFCLWSGLPFACRKTLASHHVEVLSQSNTPSLAYQGELTSLVLRVCRRPLSGLE